jgi:coenzyme F420-reducing hydrogenase delta subunit
MCRLCAKVSVGPAASLDRAFSLKAYYADGDGVFAGGDRCRGARPKQEGGNLRMTDPVRLLPQELAEQGIDSRPMNTIEQVRDLLFGDAKREHDNRIAELDQVIKSMQARIAEQLGAMEARMEAISRAHSARHEESLRQIGEAIVSVGRQISALGSVHERDRDSKA